jgi:phospholipase/carboxylesterase
MDVLKLGPLRVRRVVVAGDAESSENANKSKSLTVVLMHGFGAPGDDLVGLAEGLGLPGGTTLLFPEAPLSLTDFVSMPIFGGARAWWMIDIDRYQRAIASGQLADLPREKPEGLEDAREKLVAMLDALEASGTPTERVVLGGFSQGAMLATDVVLHTDRPFAGLVILSGTLIAEDDWRPRMTARRGLRVFQSHGTEDAILPYALAERLRGELDQAGMRVSFHGFVDGHGIPPAIMRELGGFLRAPA